MHDIFSGDNVKEMTDYPNKSHQSINCDLVKATLPSAWFDIIYLCANTSL